MKDFDFYRAKYIRDGKWRIEFFDKDKKYVGSIYNYSRRIRVVRNIYSVRSYLS